ncbi:MAG: type II toxin-antitoxin system RelE/ParE family toxin [Magnetococcus sp. DMHC-8]
MSHSITLLSLAQRQIRKLGAQTQARIIQAIRRLETDPRPDGCVKLTGMKDTYRVREGDYRVIYQVRDQKLLVLVLEVANRREVYR